MTFERQTAKHIRNIDPPANEPQISIFRNKYVSMNKLKDNITAKNHPGLENTDTHADTRHWKLKRGMKEDIKQTNLFHLKEETHASSHHFRTETNYISSMNTFFCFLHPVKPSWPLVADCWQMKSAMQGSPASSSIADAESWSQLTTACFARAEDRRLPVHLPPLPVRRKASASKPLHFLSP